MTERGGALPLLPGNKSCDEVHPRANVYHPGGHPPDRKGGWQGASFVPVDGQHWPLATAAQVLDMPEEDLRALVRIIENIRGGSIASGVIRMSPFSRQGRQPRAYPGDKLVEICEGVRKIAEGL